MIRHSRSPMGWPLDEQRRDIELGEPAPERLGYMDFDPLSDWMCAGQPRVKNNSSRTSWTTVIFRLRRAAMAMHSRVYSSTSVNVFRRDRLAFDSSQSPRPPHD
jgi:hypothetical protein